MGKTPRWDENRGGLSLTPTFQKPQRGIGKAGKSFQAGQCPAGKRQKRNSVLTFGGAAFCWSRGFWAERWEQTKEQGREAKEEATYLKEVMQDVFPFIFVGKQRF